MRSVNFKSVLWEVARRLGGNPVQNLHRGDADSSVDAINTALRYAWTYYSWPEWSPVELLPVTDGCVPWSAEGRETIESFLSMWTHHPLTDRNNALRIRYVLGPEGAHLMGPARTEVYVQYRPLPPVFTALTAEDQGGYFWNTPFYDEPAGECRVPVKPAPDTEQLPSDPETWKLMPFPYVLAPAVKAGAYAAGLDEEGQSGTAQLVEAAMSELLDHEVAIIVHQQSQDLNARLS